MKMVKVIINADGLSCKEVNEYQSMPELPELPDRYEREKYDYYYEKWQEAEKGLRTFKIINIIKRNGIDKIVINGDSKYGFVKNIEPSTLHAAEIISENTVKILD